MMAEYSVLKNTNFEVYELEITKDMIQCTETLEFPFSLIYEKNIMLLNDVSELNKANSTVCK